MTSAKADERVVGDSSARRLVVSFSGLDGAGKTRQIEALRDHLAAGGRSVEVLWIPFRVWPEPLINRLPPTLRSRLGPKRRVAPEPGAGEPDPQDAPAAGPGWTRSVARSLTSVVWTCLAAVASVSAGWSLRRRLAHSPSCVVILDRYRLDSIVKLQYWYDDVHPGPVAWLVRRLAPAPDIEFLLRVDPDVAYARKPEQWSPAQLARQSKLYDTVVAGRDVVVLDGAEEPDRLAAEVRRHVEAAAHGR